MPVASHGACDMCGVIVYRQGSLGSGESPGKVDMAVYCTAIPDTQVHAAARQTVRCVVHDVDLCAYPDAVIVGLRGWGGGRDP